MKTLSQIREASGGKEAYQKFFNSLLKKFGVSSPAELKGDDKKKFYDELDAGWESDDPNDKNERHGDPENLDPLTDVDADEDQADKAASQVTEDYHPKPLSIIRSNKLSGDALEEAYDMNEKMGKCEHCGKTHEEGACGVHEANRFSKKLNKPAKKIFDLALHAIRRNNVRGKKDQDEYVDDVAGVSLTPKEVELVKQAIQHESVEVSEVYSRAQMKKAIGIARKSGGQYTKAYKAIEKIAKGLGDEHIIAAALKRANEDLDLQKTGDAGTSKSVEEVTIRISYKELIERLTAGKGKETIGTDVDWEKIETDYGTEKKWIQQAKAKYKVIIKKDVGRYHSGASISGKKSDLIKFLQGPMYGGVEDRDIEDMWPWLLEGVSVDRRTKGFKEAMKRAEKAKLKAEKAKAKRIKEIDKAELDAKYEYDGEVDTVLAVANARLFGKSLPEDAAANNASSGEVDMAPNARKRKKKPLEVLRRNY